MNFFLIPLTTKLFDMSIETFELNKKCSVRKIAVDYSNGIVLIHSCNKIIVGVLYCPHVTGCNKTGRTK